MRVLAIDTSSNVATVAVMEDELLLGEYILNHKKTHSQKIMTMIEQILSELELTVHDIDIFAGGYRTWFVYRTSYRCCNCQSSCTRNGQTCGERRNT